MVLTTYFKNLLIFLMDREREGPEEEVALKPNGKKVKRTEVPTQLTLPAGPEGALEAGGR